MDQETEVLRQLISLLTELVNGKTANPTLQPVPPKNFIPRHVIVQRKAYWRPHGSLCWHHYVFRQLAHRCSHPLCTWRTKRPWTPPGLPPVPHAPHRTVNSSCYYHQRFGRFARKCRPGCPHSGQMRDYSTGSKADNSSTFRGADPVAHVLSTSTSEEESTVTISMPVETQTEFSTEHTPSTSTSEIATQTSDVLKPTTEMEVQTISLLTPEPCPKCKFVRRFVPHNCELVRHAVPHNMFVMNAMLDGLMVPDWLTPSDDVTEFTVWKGGRGNH